jgi:putative endonuclease
MNTTSLGAEAEKLVGSHLEAIGYLILDTNWRRQSCEIDIVAKKEEVVYFIEVKFRSSPSQGGGLEYITDLKQRQMAHAARVWSAENDWQGDGRLAGAAVDYDGRQMSLTEIEELI